MLVDRAPQVVLRAVDPDELQIAADRGLCGSFNTNVIKGAGQFITRSASVDFSGAGFGAIKTRAIEQQGMGTNSKLNVQFSDRHWYGLGNNGNTFADTGYQNTWEVTRHG